MKVKAIVIIESEVEESSYPANGSIRVVNEMTLANFIKKRIKEKLPDWKMTKVKIKIGGK